MSVSYTHLDVYKRQASTYLLVVYDWCCRQEVPVSGLVEVENSGFFLITRYESNDTTACDFIQPGSLHFIPTTPVGHYQKTSRGV